MACWRLEAGGEPVVEKFRASNRRETWTVRSWAAAMSREWRSVRLNCQARQRIPSFAGTTRAHPTCSELGADEAREKSHDLLPFFPE